MFGVAYLAMTMSVRHSSRDETEWLRHVVCPALALTAAL
jgi:hypothetical protein